MFGVGSRHRSKLASATTTRQHPVRTVRKFSRRPSLVCRVHGTDTSMEFFGSVTRIFGACVPSVAPCAAARIPSCSSRLGTIERFDWFSRRRRSTRRLSDRSRSLLLAPSRAVGISRVLGSFPPQFEQYRLRNRLLLLLLFLETRIFDSRNTEENRGRVVLSGRSCDRYIYKWRYRNEDG